jgi:hypothetical protein
MKITYQPLVHWLGDSNTIIVVEVALGLRLPTSNMLLQISCHPHLSQSMHMMQHMQQLLEEISSVSCCSSALQSTQLTDKATK